MFGGGGGEVAWVVWFAQLEMSSILHSLM